MRCEKVGEELEAFVLGALGAREERRIEAHIEGCDECARLVRDYRLAANYLALDVPLYKAPARLKERIMGAIGSASSVKPRTLRVRLFAGSLAAGLLAFAIGGLTWALVLSSEVRQLHEDNRVLASEVRQLSEDNRDIAELAQLDADQRDALLRVRADLFIAQSEQRRMVTALQEQATTLEEQATLLVLALDPDSIPTQLEGTELAPLAQCDYIWSTKQEVGGLSCTDMPATSFTLAYELWVVVGDKAYAAGAFVPRADGTSRLLVKLPEDTEGPVSNVWVTLERVTAVTGSDAEPSDEVILLPAPVQQAGSSRP